jgi:hypothetical protein
MQRPRYDNVIHGGSRRSTGHKVRYQNVGFISPAIGGAISDSFPGSFARRSPVVFAPAQIAATIAERLVS